MNKFYLASKYSNLFQKSISLFFKISLVAVLFIAPDVVGQSAVTRIHTDWNGYFTSSTISTIAANQPSTENNLLAFAWNGKTWSTGANNAALDANSVIYEDSRFRALKIQSLVYDSSSYYLQGSMIDGSLTNRVLTPALSSSLSTPAELASRLTDGINGLALGTGIANIKSTVASEFKVGTNNIQLGVIGDNIPDIIVTQVAQPNSTVDIFKFVDAAGVIVGNAVSVAFNSITPVGTYRLDLFNTNNGVPATGFSANDTREIRILGMDLGSFGITNATAPSIDRFVVSFSGSSDCAFIAFNANSMKIAQLSLVKKATMVGCGKLGDIINYTFDVTNTGEVPVTNINVIDAMPGLVLSGNPAPSYSLAVGATITITGTYTITAADVIAGRVINTAKVTGIDPSLNVIEDISGQTNTDDIPTVTNLLPPPTVGVITNQTCDAQGSVVLNNLPSGSWSLVMTPGGATTTGTGTTTTITGLAPNTYTFRVSNGTCVSPPSANVVILGRVTKIWDGMAWSPSPADVPTKDNPVIINGNYSASTNGDLNACSLTINSGTFNIEAGKFVIIQNNLTVAAGATLNVFDKGSLVMVNDNGTVSGLGTTNIQKTTTATKKLDYVYWSSPVASTTIATTFSGWRTDRAFEYNNNWIYTTAMTPAKGYIITVPNAAGVRFVNFQGQVNNGEKKITGVTTSNFYLVGNPYPSAIDANAFLNQNAGVLDGTLYFWTHNTAIQLASGIGSGKAGSGAYAFTSDDYASYNLVGGVGTGYLPISGGTLKPSGQIPSCQGFFASTRATITAPNEIVFNNSMRLGSGATKLDNSNFFRTKNANAKTAATFERHRIWLNLTNKEGAFKQTLIGYVTEATNGNESRFDGETMNGNAFIDFYSVNENKNLVIQGRALPFDENDKVAIGFKSSIAGEFSINIDEIDGVLTNQSVILEDKSTHTEFDLKTGNYTFNTTAGTFNDRFVLKYKKTDESLGTGDFETQQNQVIVAVKNKQIKINSFAGNIKKVTIYDLLGRQIYEKDNVNTDEWSIDNFVSNNQVLIVKTRLENDLILTEKVVY